MYINLETFHRTMTSYSENEFARLRKVMWIPPALRAGLQSGSIMTVADIMTQFVIEKQPELDYRRTIRWSIGGLILHGPYFFQGFQLLDQRLGPATSLKVVAQKTAL